jgi:hypothetical protein
METNWAELDSIEYLVISGQTVMELLFPIGEGKELLSFPVPNDRASQTTS